MKPSGHHQKFFVAVVMVLVIILLGILSRTLNDTLSVQKELGLKIENPVEQRKSNTDETGNEVLSVKNETWGNDTIILNSRYGFSVKLPEGWKKSYTDGMGDEVLRLENISGGVVYVAYTESLLETSLQATMEKRNSLREALSYELSNIQEVVLGGQKAYKGDFENESINYKAKHIYVEHGGHLYVIGYVLTLERDVDVHMIIDSFRFLK